MQNESPPVKGDCPESRTSFGFDLEQTQSSPRIRRAPTVEELAEIFDGFYWGPLGPPGDMHLLDLEFNHYLPRRNAFLNHARPNQEDSR